MGAYMAESFKDLHVGSDIEELFRYIEDYKPVHLDLEDSGTNLWEAAAVAIAAAAVTAAFYRQFKAQSSMDFSYGNMGCGVFKRGVQN